MTPHEKFFHIHSPTILITHVLTVNLHQADPTQRMIVSPVPYPPCEIIQDQEDQQVEDNIPPGYVLHTMLRTLPELL